MRYLLDLPSPIEYTQSTAHCSTPYSSSESASQSTKDNHGGRTVTLFRFNLNFSLDLILTILLLLLPLHEMR